MATTTKKATAAKTTTKAAAKPAAKTTAKTTAKVAPAAKTKAATVKPAANTATPTGAFISDYTSGGGEYWTGKIDEAQVYNYTLTAAQVLDLYNSGAARYGPVTGAP
jgi:hypothetical protein